MSDATPRPWQGPYNIFYGTYPHDIRDAKGESIAVFRSEEAANEALTAVNERDGLLAEVRELRAELSGTLAWCPSCRGHGQVLNVECHVCHAARAAWKGPRPSGEA